MGAGLKEWFSVWRIYVYSAISALCRCYRGLFGYWIMDSFIGDIGAARV